MRKTLALWWCLAALAACTSATPEPPTAAPPASAPTSALVTATSAPGPLTTAPPATAATVRDEFVATDPATVNLALGRPQFVEFFAFY